MKAVVFDFGAVLFHWQPLELLQAVVPELAPDLAAAQRLAGDIFQSFVPGSDWSSFDLGLLQEEELAGRIAQRIGAAPQQLRRVIDAIPLHLQAEDATVALLKRLQAAGHRSYFLSNMPLPYAQHLERANPFLADFDDGIFSARVGLMKPHPEIYALAETRFGLDPAHTVFIDDHAGNIETARARGWQAVHYTGAPACEAALSAAGWL